MGYRKLADLQRERKAWLEKIYVIDSELSNSYEKLTLTQIKDKKKPIGEYQKNVNKIKKMIEDGEYEEARESLF